MSMLGNIKSAVQKLAVLNQPDRKQPPSKKIPDTRQPAMAKLKTRSSSRYVSSRNDRSFNAKEDAVRFVETRAVYPEGFLKENGERIFHEVLDEIDRRTELCECFVSNNCSKAVVHRYPSFYHRLLKDHRRQDMNFVEIGIGSSNEGVPSKMGDGYKFGASLRGWRSYFANADFEIFGGDIDPRVLIQEDRITTHYINQLNPDSIQRFIDSCGFSENGIDFILDDGLHEFRSNLTLLLSAWPHVKSNGYYVIEDMSDGTYKRLLDTIETLSLGADCFGFEFPNEIKPDSRVIVLQKTN